MSTPIYFNAFKATIDQTMWQRFAIKRRSGKVDKQLRAEIARLWREGKILAEATESECSWVLIPAVDQSILSGNAYVPASLDAVPPSVLLNFYVLTRSETAGSRAVFIEPTKKYWETKRSKKGDVRYCLYPQFSMWDGMLIVNVSATCIRTATTKHKRAFQVFDATEGVEHRSVGYRVPQEGEVIKDPPAKGAKIRIPWTPNSSDVGPLASKMNFLDWLVGNIEASGAAILEPLRFDGVPVKALIGVRGQDAKLKKDKMVRAIAAAMPAMTVDVYDRRTEAGNHASWSAIISALSRVAGQFDTKIVDHGSAPHQPGVSPVFVAIDSEDLFDTDDADTKPDAVASFTGPVQCFSTGILKEDENSVGEVADSVFLVMMANFLIKREVAKGQLLMHREWACQTTTGNVGDYIFCERFEVGEDAIYVGLSINSSGTLEFSETTSLRNLFSMTEQRKLTPAFKRKQGDPGLEQWTGTIEIQDTPIKALPLLSREHMTPHFSGVRVIRCLNAYYAGGAERPGSGKVEKALTLRQVSRIGGNRPNDLEMMAGFCVDPTVRVHAATVWPAPFKLIREYMAMKRSQRTKT